MSDLVKRRGILIFKRRLTAINENISDKQPYKAYLLPFHVKSPHPHQGSGKEKLNWSNKLKTDYEKYFDTGIRNFPTFWTDQ